MQNFAPKTLFDLSNFAHAAIFNDVEHAWQVLLKLPSYLKGLKLGKIESTKQEYAFLVNPELISIGEGTIIEAGAYIRGPCVIGKRCHIRNGAYIRGDVLVGDDCVIGHTTELKHAILLNHSNAAHFAYVADSIIGNHVNLGAGVKCANLKLKGDAVKIHHKGKEFNTGMRKLGAIIGDNCQIGCNVVLNPGTVLAKDVFCHPSISVGGVIPENSCIKPEVKIQITLRK